MRYKTVNTVTSHRLAPVGVTENGIDVGDMNAKLLQKVEELTLYIIDMQKQIAKQQEEIKNLKNQ